MGLNEGTAGNREDQRQQLLANRRPVPQTPQTFTASNSKTRSGLISESAIAALTRYFMAKYSKENDRVVNHISSEALALLKDHSWPGNVRELKNVIERAVVLGSGDTIVPEDLPSELRVDDSARLGLRGHADKASHEYIEKVLIQADGDYREAARIADFHPNSMHRLIKKHHLAHLLKNRRREEGGKAARA